MNKVVPLIGLMIFLVIVAIRVSNPNTSRLANSNLVTAQETQGSKDSDPVETETSEDDAKDTEENQPVETLSIPEGFSQTPYLSDEQLQVFERAEQVIETGKDYQVIIETTAGTLRADLFEDKVPQTVNNFVFLALHKYYDGIIFHRVLEDFMAQTGDPTGTGRGDPGYKFADEFDASLRHNKPGILSMANSGPDTNGSQFFITFTETPWLDDKHSVFGEVIEGAEVLDKLTRIDPSNNGPSIIINLDAPLSELKEKGIMVEGADDSSVESYLIESFGTLPEMGSPFQVSNLDAVIGRVGQTPALGIYSNNADSMTRVSIIERSKTE